VALDQLLYAGDVALAEAARRGELPWVAHDGGRASSRTAEPAPWRSRGQYEPFPLKPISLEPPAYFKTDDPDADRMTYRELRSYIGELEPAAIT